MPLFSTVNSLRPGERKPTVKVRAVRVYTTPAREHGEINSIEIVFHDREFSRILCTIHRRFVTKYIDFFKEGHLYAIREFYIEANDLNYKTTSHLFKMVFNEKTTVFEVFDSRYPSMMFNFKTFQTLHAEKDNDPVLFDVIGKVVEMRSPQTRMNGGYLTRFIDILLEDLQSNTLNCTLWGNEVDEFQSYIAKEEVRPIVMVLTFCRSKVFRDAVCVSNTFHSSKMILNGEIEEVNDFRTRLLLKDNGSHSIIQVTPSEPTAPIDEPDLSKFTFKTTMELHDSEDGKFWLAGRIKTIESFRDWYYIGCKYCSKKINMVGKKNICDKCKKRNAIGIPSVSVLLWDQFCSRLIGMSASELRAKSLEHANEDCPAELENMLNKDLLLLVSVRKIFGPPYSVSKLIDDATVVAKYTSALPEDEGSDSDSDFFSRLGKSGNEDDIKVLSDCEEVNTPVKKLDNKATLRDSHRSDAKMKRPLIDDSSELRTTKKMKESIGKDGK